MATPPPIPDALDNIGRAVVDSAFKVHSTLGPGLLESVYETCLEYEIGKRNLSVVRQTAMPIRYEGEVLEAGLRLDLVINDSVIVEIKAVEKMLPVFEAQLLTYLKLSGKRLGDLINFNVPLIRDGIKRMAL